MNQKFAFDYATLPYRGTGTVHDIVHINWRVEKLCVQNQELIRDKVVLDLASANGNLSYPCLTLGAKRVVGVEGRLSKIQEGQAILNSLNDNRDHDAMEERMEWVNADVFEYLSKAKPGCFDTILCAGFLYHTVRQVEFFLHMSRLKPKAIIIDTSVSSNYCWYGIKTVLSGGLNAPCLRLHREGTSLDRDTMTDDGYVLWPSSSFLEGMLTDAGYQPRRIRCSLNDALLGPEPRKYYRVMKAMYVGVRK